MSEAEEVMMPTTLVTTRTTMVPMVPAANVSRESACRMKGYSHPGSYIDLPGGQKIHMQFDASPLNVRNGLTSTELFAALRDHFAAYQNPSVIDYQEGDEDDPGHTDFPAPIVDLDEKTTTFTPHLASKETDELVRLLDRCWLLTQRRQLDREARGVRFKDKA